ncbi:MAG: tRNA uridine-5-carboxymethylaminomethyl(34) synthesis GTPase MnmE, partial [Angelakisella sp.]
MVDNKTIAAIATGTGGGIGVVRLSGMDALTIAAAVFSGNKAPQRMPGYTGTLGWVHDRDGVLDQAVLFVYRAPHSYTGEDVCELSCHGGSYLLQRVLGAVIEAGAVPAAPGEFTKRALLNGKLTLTEAEAVAQLIAAESRQAAGAALDAYDGALFH